MDLKKPDRLVSELKGVKFLPHFNVYPPNYLFILNRIENILFNEIKSDSKKLIKKLRNLMK